MSSFSQRWRFEPDRPENAPSGPKTRPAGVRLNEARRVRREARGEPVGPRRVVQEEAWRRDAACAGSDPDLFFPVKGDVTSERAAKAVCAGCPVREDCLEWGLAHPSEAGILGGESHKERRRIARERKRSAA